MKKSLIALATLAAAGASFAQSSVTLFGTFDPSIANSKTTYGDGKSVSNNAVRNNSQGTSQISVKGVEDLGGGLKASFMLENDFDTRYDARGGMGSVAGVNGVNLGSGGGEQYLGLEGGFGSLKVGAANTPTLTVQASRQPFSTKIGGGFNGVTGTGHVRSNNSIVYATPVFSGFSLAAAYGFKSNAVPASTPSMQAQTNTGAADTTGLNTVDQTGISDLGVNYANGPVAAGLSQWTTAALGATPKVVQNNAFASYNLGVATLIAGMHTEKQGTTVNATGYNIAAVVPMSANMNLLANYGKLNDKMVANKDKTIAAVGVKYTLSARSSLYARYVDEKNDNVTSATSAKAVKTALIGMQHNF
jgi:predicted porin